MGDTNKERLKAIREAWKNERAYVREEKELATGYSPNKGK
jgi:hypothetical protein